MFRNKMFRNRVGLWVGSLALISFSISLGAGAAETEKGEKIYVQSVKADLKTEPKLTATSVLSLRRGAELLVLKKEGAWLNVTSAGKTGWISKLFVNSNKPVGAAELATELLSDQGLAKATRRRSSSYAVSASTRGLTAGSRTREGREKYQADYDAVDKLEKTDQKTLSEKDVRKFQDDGKLGQ